MRRVLWLALFLLPLAFSPACGGGGGGSSSSSTPCTKPGTLRALALQGQPAAGTAGNFGPFPIGMTMDVAAGGWAAFAGTTSDPLVPRGLWVALPDGSLKLVWKSGETVPNAGGGTINTFDLLRVNSQGQIVVEVSIVGDTGSRAYGLLGAQVVGGVVTGKTNLVYDKQDMGPSGASGALTDIDENRFAFVDDGRVFFAGQTTTVEAFWKVSVDGSGLTSQVKVGDTLPNAATITDLRGVGVSADGNRFAFVADWSGTSSLVTGSTDSASFAFVAAVGSGLVSHGGGSVLSVHSGGPLLVYNSGSVLWRATGSLNSPDHVVLLGNSTVPFTVLARSGDTASSAGGATFGTLDLIQHRPESSFPLMDAQLIGAPSGVPRALYGLSTTPPALALYQNRAAPSDLGQTTSFANSFPGLNTPPYVDVARDGGLAFAGLLQNGTSGIFWLLPTCGFFTVAASSQGSPDGDTFGAFSPQATHTTSDGVVLFRAALATAGSGVYRQGP